MTVTHWLDGARNACGANLQQFGHSSREYVTCPKCLRSPCGHTGCRRQAVKVVGAVDEPNTLGQTHDCCARHCTR